MSVCGLGEGRQGRLDGLQVQALDHPERHGETPQAVARAGGAERLTYQAPLTVKTVATLRCGFRARLTPGVDMTSDVKSGQQNF
jgi:hypothetical protein